MLYTEALEHSSANAKRCNVNVQRLREIINETTKAHPVIDDRAAASHFTWARTTKPGLPSQLAVVWVDCHFHKLAVDTTLAKPHRDEVIAILREWPKVAGGRTIPSMSDLPTFADMSAVLDEHGAFGLLALGQALGLWEVNTPATYGFAAGSPNADNAARTGGYLRISRWSPTP